MLDRPHRPCARDGVRRALQLLAFVCLLIIFVALFANALCETAAFGAGAPYAVVVVGEAS